MNKYLILLVLAFSPVTTFGGTVGHLVGGAAVHAASYGLCRTALRVESKTFCHLWAGITVIGAGVIVEAGQNDHEEFAEDMGMNVLGAASVVGFSYAFDF